MSLRSFNVPATVHARTARVLHQKYEEGDWSGHWSRSKLRDIKYGSVCV